MGCNKSKASAPQAQQAPDSTLLKPAGGKPNENAALDREALLKEIFKKCDDDLSGFLSVAEFQQLSKENSSQDQALMSAMFEMIDKSGVEDGKLSLEEFVKFNLQTGSSLSEDKFREQAKMWEDLATTRVVLGAAGREDLLKNAFTTCDIDKSGWLSVSEYKQLAAEDSNATQDLKALFDLIDAGCVKDGKVFDAKDGKLRLDDFVCFNLEAGKSQTDADFREQVDMWLALFEKRCAASAAGHQATKKVERSSPCC